MGSVSNSIAIALTAAINAMPLDGVTLPLAVAGYELATPLAYNAVAAELRRGTDEKLRVIVSPARRELTVNQTRDRCAPRWSTDLFVIVEKQITADEETDELQPGTIAEVDFGIEFSEMLAAKLANDRGIISATTGLMLLGIEHTVLISEEELRKSRVFFSQIGVTYGS